ncbi:universal stress protein [Sinomicrobium pectinilyticum]|uniref:Universal stress protein n=1 Tax=Sinomicrobium pectinilyticum TaxID=1084421 RepID=A0A3N0EQ18_SINP1|nr:universal stress protein [Sinomicrobium pectinilyticum]RNL89891.1 universal stress protein [Sinomicrobium pectinilyticum]
MKNILIPTDFSENSRNAARYALLLFGTSACNFYLCNVVEPYVYTGGGMPLVAFPEDYDTGVRARSEESLKKMALRMKKELPESNSAFIPLPVHDFFIEAIRKQVKEKNIDLIVMGTKGASGLREMMVGSNTGDVITKVKCPVLVVPEDAAFHFPGQIVFPTDYSISYSPRVLDTLFFLADKFSAAVRVLHIVKNEHEILGEAQKINKNQLKNYLRGREHSFHRMNRNNLGEAIEEFTDIADIDWIAMMAKKLNFFQQALFRPAVARISYHTRIPFLVLHE